MKHWIALAVVVVLGVAALILAEKRKVDAPVGPGAFLYFIADTERELTRLPVAFHPMSDDEEITIGDALARGYLGAGGQTSGNPQAQLVDTYVQQVGASVATHARRRLPYRFHYIPNHDFVNAFALPGGHVFIGAGLIDLMDSEDELAAVLGHEVEHIDHYHCAERVETEAALRKIPLGMLVQLPVEVFQAGYSKDQELEADREGTRLAVAASYSPLGAIRMFETYNRLYQEEMANSQTPQEELSRVAVEALEGYFRSHPLPSERIEQIRRLIAAESWGGLTRERPLAVAYIFWTERARRALAAKHYEQALNLAAHSLELQSNQPEALDILAQARFMLADFAGASANLRKLLDANNSDAHVAAMYAQSLAATGQYQKGAQEFQAWLAGAKLSSQDLLPQLQVDLAGLDLMAGNATRAESIEAQLQQLESTEDWAPECEGQLGSWYYWAGRYSQSAALLSRALQQRPQDAYAQTALGWTAIELRDYGSAIARFGVIVNSNNRPVGWIDPSSHARSPAGAVPAATMGLAVARWRARQIDNALADYAVALVAEPSWLNPRWVKALYAPSVVTSIAEMQAERERRLAEERSHTIAHH